MDKNTIKDRIRGSLIGGAIGDALGYPVEFIYSFGEIQRKYGRNGITRLDTHQWWLEEDNGNGKAVVSDDTQMTLFTACGLLNAKTENEPFLPSICEAYIEWLFAQKGKKKKGYDKCWISDVPELNVRRAPGKTCITSLNDIFRGVDPINNSKGCGGVMRIAPIPLYGATADRMDIQEVCKLAADASELTHQHPLGYIPSALVAYVIYKLVQDEAPERETYKDYIREGLKVIAELFPNYPVVVKQFTTLIKTAILWSDISTDDVRTIEEELGGGWVAEETVAIAVYCSLAYFDNFERAMIAAVNHKGDSDSTGAVTGNILGAAFGYNAIPQHFKDDVELHDVILHVADDLWRGETTEFLITNRNCIAMKYDKQNLINAARTFTRDDFVFFWEHTDRQESVDKICLSQWYMCSFMVENVYYNCAEQYMMAEKARIFGDDDAWQQIMASYDPMTIKKLGKKVRNFNAYVWKKNCQEVVKRGNLAKFSQNPKLMEYLLGTGDKILVEASPKDKIWGIGLAEDAPEASNPRLWQGENLLGFTLMEVRDMLRAKEENSADNVSEEDMKKTLLMWTMGAGNSARRFNYEDPIPEKTEVAKPWGNPLDVYVSVPQEFYLTSKQMDIIRYGHIPDAMEDHWYMYCDDNAIHYLRSWTGFHIFEAHYERNGDEYRITELRINNNPNEYRLSNAESDIALFYALLISEYGGDASAYWNAAF